ncbi:MAG: hypothetical protein PHO56_04845 [Patescibacteria group bacterium]|nr:hypothetical protein [Patescibacteria group bacterium]
MADRISSPKRPRFYYGPVERELGDKKGYQLCLLDLKSGLFAWFDYPAHLGKAIAMLIEPVAGERQEHRIFQLPNKRITSEIPADDFEDFLNEADALAERGAEESAFSLCDPLMIRKDHLRNFSAVENDHLFSEHSASDCPARKEGLKKAKMLDYIPAAEYQDVCKLRELDELESENHLYGYGPFFSEADFTDDLNCVPEEFRIQYKFLDMNTLLAQAQAIKEEVRVVFHPDQAEAIRRSHGLAGVIDGGPRDDSVQIDDGVQVDDNIQVDDSIQVELGL